MKNLAIKQAAVFCVVLLGFAVAANADTFALSSSGGDFGHFNFTAYVNRTVNYVSSGYDRLQIRISSMNGADAGNLLEANEGTWSISGYTGFEMASDSAVAAYNSDQGTAKVWGAWTANATPNPALTNYGQSTTYLSNINFDSIVGNDWISPLGPYRSGSGEIFSSFFGGWYTSALASYLGTGNTIATLYVPTGGTPTPGSLLFSGTFSFNDGNNAERSNLYFVPEPGTLALLGAGLIGLLAYAWRKRK